MKEFIMAALPLVITGTAVAVVVAGLAVKHKRKKNGNPIDTATQEALEKGGQAEEKGSDEEDNNMAMGMSLGMCCGVAIGIAIDQLALGISLGMLIGMCIGRSIKKK